MILVELPEHSVTLFQSHLIIQIYACASRPAANRCRIVLRQRLFARNHLLSGPPSSVPCFHHAGSATETEIHLDEQGSTSHCSSAHIRNRSRHGEAVRGGVVVVVVVVAVLVVVAAHASGRVTGRESTNRSSRRRIRVGAGVGCNGHVVGVGRVDVSALKVDVGGHGALHRSAGRHGAGVGGAGAAGHHRGGSAAVVGVVVILVAVGGYEGGEAKDEEVGELHCGVWCFVRVVFDGGFMCNVDDGESGVFWLFE